MKPYKSDRYQVVVRLPHGNHRIPRKGTLSCTQDRTVVPMVNIAILAGFMVFMVVITMKVW